MTTDSVELINGTTYITYRGIRKTARHWHNPNVCSWDAFRSRIKRYRREPSRYNLGEVIHNKKYAAKRIERIVKPRGVGQHTKAGYGIQDPIMRQAVCGRWR